VEERVIAEYLERLERELAHDRGLARRVRREAEDHLREAVAADPAGPDPDAERRAVERFGDARAVAAQFAAVALSRRARLAGTAAVLAIAAVFAAMKGRLLWYEVTAWPPAASRALSAWVLEADRWTFWLAFAAGIASWIWVGRLGVPDALASGYGARVRGAVRLGRVAGAALAACVAADGVLTGLRLAGGAKPAGALVPLVSIALEAACAAALIASFRGLARRMTSA
jgi:HAAS domain-containing protein